MILMYKPLPILNEIKGVIFLKLFEPIKIHEMMLENRTVYPAVVSRLAHEEGFVTDNLRDRILRIARGGVGLIILEPAAIIDRKSGTLLKIFDDKFIPGLKQLVTEVHEKTQAKIGIQLIHFLKLSKSGYRETVEDLSMGDIKQIVEDFGAAAARVKTAGFDCIELHCAHAYTLSSFLSLLNKRRDEYGRDIEGRIKIVKEVLSKVKMAVGEKFTVGCRINGDEFVSGGSTLLQTRTIVEMLSKMGIHYVSISAGGKFEDGQIFDGIVWPYSGYSGMRTMPPSYMPEGVNVYLAGDLRKIASLYNVPVFIAGKISHPDFTESILLEEKADLVALGRQLICDPDWPNKVKNNIWGDIVYCKYCGGCTENDRKFQPVVCRQWPKGSLQAPENFSPKSKK